ncbi:LysR family transcriptional regulator [Bordetella genomosp. 9]|uniref:LysR family transcriptional regulator n=1 Tax=Bordetella genomosp. 9 TaxID=1416803 RepID=A0A261R309_9BORD|nr:LysR family transcriptional regulator [Bordetella genomosp. 9]OZI18990.1 LysR family transcriptional regulator [Bordetella genomosp. 9]
MLNRRELALLRAMYQHQTVTAAAASIHMAQPAASALLRDLETRLGFALFSRENRRLQLTSQGRALLPEVLNALAGIEAVDRLARDIRHGSATRLAIGAVAISASSLFPAALARLRRGHPDVAVTMRAGTALEIVDMAVDHRIDLGIIIGSSPDERVDMQVLSTLSLFCVLRPDHPLAARKRLSLREAVRDQAIVLGTALPAGRATARALEAAGLSHMPTVEVMQSSAACALVAAGVGIAIVESLGAIYAQRQGLSAIRLMRVDDLALRLVWPRHRGVSPPAAELRRCLVNEAAALGLDR